MFFRVLSPRGYFFKSSGGREREIGIIDELRPEPGIVDALGRELLLEPSFRPASLDSLEVPGPCAARRTCRS